MKHLAMLLALCASVGAASAQTPSVTPNPEPGTTAADQATLKPKTVRGCLNSVGDNFTVTDQATGKTYKLAGETDRLKQYIGQTVEITGSVKSLDADSTPAAATSGDILTLADVKLISDQCSGKPTSGALITHAPVLLALMQRPVNSDANTQLDDNQQMSSYATVTSAAAANTRSVTTKHTEHAFIDVGGHAGQHSVSVNTSSTQSVGQTTPPPNSARGFATDRSDKNNVGVNPQAFYPGNAAAPKKQVPTYLNAEAIGHSAQDGDAAAVAASSAEMQTSANGSDTTWRTARKSEANGSPNANPKELEPPSPNVKTETTPVAPK